MAMNTVWMRHPNLPDTQLIEIPVEAQRGHEKCGWQVTDPPKPPQRVTDESAADDKPTTPSRQRRTTTLAELSGKE